MSNIADIRAAKQRYNDHIEQHKCRTGECEQRRAMWLAYQATAGRWGKEEQCQTPTVQVSSSGTEFV